MLKTYRYIYISELLKQIVNNAMDVGKAKLYLLRLDIDDREMLRELLVKATLKEPKLTILSIVPQNNKTYIEISLGSEAQKNIDVKSIVLEISKYVNIKAGGKKDHITGVIESDINMAEKIIEKIIQDYIKTQTTQT
jgi:alanyl-tRNA synthetase